MGPYMFFHVRVVRPLGDSKLRLRMPTIWMWLL
jgi:hypothetical protein